MNDKEACKNSGEGCHPLIITKRLLINDKSHIQIRGRDQRKKCFHDSKKLDSNQILKIIVKNPLLSSQDSNQKLMIIVK